MPGLAHLYSGEEAVAVGVCEALRYRRLHHQYASRPRTLSGEGRVAGSHVRRAAGQRSGLLPRQRRIDAHRRSGNGKLGSERDCWRKHGHRHRRGFFGKDFGHGPSRSLLLRRRSARPGVLYEVMNMAQLWKLPVIYVCENNLYNEYTHFSETTAGDYSRPRHRFWYRSRKRRRSGCARSK
jgi:acetoin:2,6-dichlorophenolindophenol oxidoreductase subunit alpha